MSVAELWFDDLASLHAAVRSPAWQALREDGGTLFAQPMGVGVARERIQKDLDVLPPSVDRLLIDPKPCIGEAHYDVLQLLLNCEQSLPAGPVGLLTEVADLAGLVRGGSGDGCSPGGAGAPR